MQITVLDILLAYEKKTIKDYSPENSPLLKYLNDHPFTCDEVEKATTAKGSRYRGSFE
jgi:hypothetical protein